MSSDVPIITPEQDSYGIDEFAQTMARSIARARADQGLVFAIYGPWGSGKSSACNLVLHHLDDEIKTKRIVPVAFNPWWFSGSEALTVSFFEELGVAIGKSVSKKARQLLSSLGRRVSRLGPILEPVGTVLGAPGAGTVIAGGAEAASRLDEGSTVDEVHTQLAQSLRAQSRKFLVVIDDIDRLGTDDALQIFKLVKSVGRLPNVIYLLAFDRSLAESMISQRFPSEGASYLDKFIQGGFDLPLPDSHDLRDAVLETVESVMGSIPEGKLTRFFNLFYDICLPLLHLPRDAVRLGNAIRVTWPVIGENVDRADFLALESLRLFLPSVHRAIRQHPEMLCGLANDRNHHRDQDVAEYNETFLTGLSARDRQIAQRALQRLFPRVEAVWSNNYYTDADDWRRDRLVCSETHFPTYFGFTVNEEAVTASELRELLRVVGNADDVAELFRRTVAQHRRRGGTRAALLLEELRVQAESIPEPNIETLLSGLFSVADEIDVEADRGRAFGSGSNPLRIHWLLNNLVRDRFEQSRRGEILEPASSVAALGWLIDLSERCSRDHGPRDPQERGERREPLVPAEVAQRISTRALERIRAAGADGTLTRHHDLAGLVFSWRNLASDTEVRTWSDAQLASDEFVATFAERVIQHTWSQSLGMFGGGDRVARRSEYVNLQQYSGLLDVPRFTARVQEMLARQDLPHEQRRKLERFASTPERDPRRRA